MNNYENADILLVDIPIYHHQIQWLVCLLSENQQAVQSLTCNNLQHLRLRLEK